MKERIYTIPVNDAFNAICECPICFLEAKTTNDLLNYYMGASMMESDVRKVTNEKGFCKEHSAAMYNMQENRLTLALILHTHLKDLCDDINKKMTKISSPSKMGNFFSSGKDIRQSLISTAESIDKRVADCALCERLEYTMDRYIDVILWQYFEEKKFKEKFNDINGFCLPHIALLLRGCEKYLSGAKTAEFLKALTDIQNKSMETLRDELEWFTLKFDYVNKDKPWGNSKDAIPRTIRKEHGRPDLNQ